MAPHIIVTSRGGATACCADGDAVELRCLHLRLSRMGGASNQIEAYASCIFFLRHAACIFVLRAYVLRCRDVRLGVTAFKMS